MLAIEDELTRAKELGKLAPRLSDEQIRVAYAATADLENPNARFLALEGIGPYLSGPLAEDALSQAASLPDEYERANVLASISDRLPDERVAEAWEMAEGMREEGARLHASIALLPRFPTDQRASQLSDVLALARRSDDDERKVRDLTTLYDYVPDNMKADVASDVFETAEHIKDPIESILTSVRVAPIFVHHGGGGAILKAIFRVEALEDGAAETLIRISEMAPGGFLPELIEAATKIEDPDERSRALIFLDEALKRWNEEQREKSGPFDVTTETAQDSEPEVQAKGPEQTVADDGAQQKVGQEQQESMTPPDTPPAADTPPAQPPTPPEPTPPVATFLHSDQWTDQDTLGRDLYAKAISEFLKNDDTKAPLTVGILAPWGQGKTSLMKMIQGHMRNESGKSAAPQDDGGGQAGNLPNEPSNIRRRFWQLWLHKAKAGDHPLRQPLHRTRATVGSLEKWLEEGVKPEIGKLEYPTIWFNAWKYQSGEQIWAGLADAIITQLAGQIDDDGEREKFWLALQAERLDPTEIRQDIRDRTFERFFPKVRLSAALGVAGLAIAGVGALASAVIDNQLFPGDSLIATITGVVASLSGAADGWRKWGKTRDEVKEEPLDGSLARLVRRPDYEGMQGLFHQVELDVRRVFDLLVHDDKPAVVFIDDLDRYSPGRLAEVLETVNLFLSGDFPKCYFVVGMDAQVAAASMEVAHKDLNKRLQRMTRRYGSLGWYFMDKFIQLPFVIPNLDQSQSQEYLSGLFKQSADSTTDDDSVRETDEQREERDTDAARSAASMLKDKNIRASDLGKRLAPHLSRLRLNRQDEFQQFSRMAIERGAEEFTDDDPEIQANLIRYGRFLGGNPRTMKRFANLYRFYRLAQWSRELQGLESASPSALGRWLVVMLRWPQLVRWIQWESESQLDGDATPGAKASSMEEDLREKDTFEKWMALLKVKELDQLARLVDRPLYEFLRGPREDDESLSRATEVGVW